MQKLVEELKLNDSRTEFIAIFLLNTFNQKSEKWTKMYSSEENKAKIYDFLNTKTSSKLTFCLTSSNFLVLSNEFPTQISTKVAYFIKYFIGIVDKNSRFQDQVMYGDVSQSPLDQIYSLLDGVSLRFR